MSARKTGPGTETELLERNTAFICNEGLYDFIDLSSTGRKKKKTELVATPNIGLIGGPVETLWQATELFPNGIVEGMVTDSLL